MLCSNVIQFGIPGLFLRYDERLLRLFRKLFESVVVHSFGSFMKVFLFLVILA